jgi:hypothetical protein
MLLILAAATEAFPKYASRQTPQLRGSRIRLEENFLGGWDCSV